MREFYGLRVLPASFAAGRKDRPSEKKSACKWTKNVEVDSEIQQAFIVDYKYRMDEGWVSIFGRKEVLSGSIFVF